MLMLLLAYRTTKIPILFFFAVLLTSTLFQNNYVHGQAGFKPAWLRVGCAAYYEFGNLQKPGLVNIYFNECWAFGRDISGNCSWRILSVGNGVAEVEVVYTLAIPGCSTYDEYITKLRAHELPAVVEYDGEEFFALAKKGNFSFMTTFPQDQIDPTKAIIFNNSVTGGIGIQYWGGFFIQKTFRVNVDLQSLNIIDESGNVLGKWLFWINPVMYPVDESVEEIAMYNWNGITVKRNVTYCLPGKGNYWQHVETPLGNFSEYYQGQIPSFQIVGTKLVSTEPIWFLSGETYEPRVGILLNALGYEDDFLAQRLGILLMMTKYFWLSRLEGIDLKPQSGGGFSLAGYAPYLVACVIAVSAVSVYWSYRKRSKR
jgi:hypothetical protein